MMLLLEWQFQRVLGDPDFGIPYWDWAADGDRPVTQQPSRPIWSATRMGGNGRASDSVVTSGPFRSGQFTVGIETGPGGGLRATNRPLRRRFAAPELGLPTKAEVGVAMGQTAFDEEVGLVGGGHHEPGPLTVTTYDSAYLHMERLGNRFGLVVFDECHHLPSESYALAARCCLAPSRPRRRSR